MAKRIHDKKLLVEGMDDKRVIPYLIEANGITWGESEDEWVVSISEFNGISNLLKAGVIETELRASGLRIAGIVADANANADERWQAIRNRCLVLFPGLPDAIDQGGLIQQNDEGLKLGVWLMPDNRSRGMLETFLTFLVPDEKDNLVTYAQTACDQARNLGAPFQPVHSDKARIHTWLAWQDEPGRQLHQAVNEQVLDPNSPHADPFVRWFCDLFELRPSESS